MFSSTSRGGMAPGVLLSSRNHIERMDAGLHSIQGAQEIITMITSRRMVTKLILGHNRLLDDGCVVLFKFLNSSIGRTYRITNISLNSNGIGNFGLLAIADYLKDNQTLKELFLQNNLFTGDPETILPFTRALNSSMLEVLTLTTDRLLGDTFLETFMPTLESSTLRELHLSAIALTPKSAPHIAAYISSRARCSLHTLKCNGNALGFRGVKSIIRAIEQDNFKLSSVEIYSNNLAEDDDSGDDDDPPNSEAWKETENHLRQVLSRNEYLKSETGKEAVNLLRYSRSLLLDPRGDSVVKSASNPSTKATLPAPCSELCACIPGPAPMTSSSSKTPLEQSLGFPFRSLPIELQLYVLSLLTPILSPVQRINICTYASSLATLPPLLPCLESSFGSAGMLCVPDPLSMGFRHKGGRDWTVKGAKAPRGGCAAGQCMGSKNSVVCHREEERGRWLDLMGCSAYDPVREE